MKNRTEEFKTSGENVRGYDTEADKNLDLSKLIEYGNSNHDIGTNREDHQTAIVTKGQGPKAYQEKGNVLDEMPSRAVEYWSNILRVKFADLLREIGFTKSNESMGLGASTGALNSLDNNHKTEAPEAKIERLSDSLAKIIYLDIQEPLTRIKNGIQPKISDSTHFVDEKAGELANEGMADLDSPISIISSEWLNELGFGLELDEDDELKEWQQECRKLRKDFMVKVAQKIDAQLNEGLRSDGISHFMTKSSEDTKSVPLNLTYNFEYNFNEKGLEVVLTGARNADTNASSLVTIGDDKWPINIIRRDQKITIYQSDAPAIGPKTFPFDTDEESGLIKKEKKDE